MISVGLSHILTGIIFLAAHSCVCSTIHDSSANDLYQDRNTNSLVDTERKSEFKRVCYFENWAISRPAPGSMGPDDIDPSLCTHIMYGFATLNPTTLLMQIHDQGNDINRGFYKKITDMKNAGLKVMIALGGWNDSKGNKYSTMVSTKASRKKFIDDAIGFIQRYNFDGIDLDWEFPVCWQANCNTGSRNDKSNFASLVKELKEALQPKNLLLTAAVSASKWVIDNAYDIPSISRDLDFINVMNYDYHGSWEGKTGHHSPLYDDKDVWASTDASIRYFIEKGAPPEKLVLGMPTYGKTFTLSSATSNGLGAPTSGAGSSGICGWGLLAYFEICDRVKTQGWTKVDDASGNIGPYAYKGSQWVGYDDIRMIKIKSEYIKSMGLGGGMVWAMGMDDFSNICGYGKYPLLNAIKSVLTGEPNDGNEPTSKPTTGPATTTATGTDTTAKPTTTRPTIPPTTKTPSGNCCASGPWAGDAGMTKWCMTSCNAAHPYCPASHCTCNNC